MSLKKPIAIGLSPNTQTEDVQLALRLLFSPWKYILGNGSKELERWFRTFFKVSGAIAFVNARSALYAILHALEIKKGDEVLLQAFTCIAVPNAIIATGAKPIYVDIDDSLNINPDLIEKSITKNTKAIVVQHTFAIPANIDAIIKITKKYKLFLIEDCAHTIGGEYKKRKLGTFGIASCFSFGRDKAFSSVFGGMAITDDKDLQQTLRSYEKQKSFPPYVWVLQQLVYAPVCWIILKFYYVFSLGKILHFILRRFRFFSYPVTPEEKNGAFNSRDVKRLPNALAELALLQVKKGKEYNQQRENIAARYGEKLQKQIIRSVPYLRYPLLVDDKKKAKLFFGKRGIFIGDWYTQAIDPSGVELSKIGYQLGSCPEAEKIAQRIINLPTCPTMRMEDAEKVIEVFEKYERE